MKNVLTKTFLTLALAATAGATAFAKPKPKHSAEHNAAVKKCDADYAAAIKGAKGLKGQAHKDAVAKAKADKKQCIAAAPM